MFDIGLILLIVVAIGIGWALGRYDRIAHERKLSVIKAGTGSVPKEYFQGLNFLLNEQPDLAVDLFAKTIDVNSDTVEIYLALGSNFRKRGEVDRAIKIHQDLLARPNLERKVSADIQLALGQDYLAAGLLDRAERLLNDLIVQSDEHSALAIRLLIRIYEQEREWQRALECAAQLKEYGVTDINVSMAHYHCELAQVELLKGDLTHARAKLHKALKEDKRCARASLMLGEVEYRAGRCRNAIEALKKITSQDIGYLAESMAMLKKAYDDLGDYDDLIDYLYTCGHASTDETLILKMADIIADFRSPQEAIDWVERFIGRVPSFVALNWLVKHQKGVDNSKLNDYLCALKDLTHDRVAKDFRYHCTDCGFKGNTLHWMCPSCKNWATYKPQPV